MDNYFSGSAETTDARNAGDILSVPLYAELERFIGIEAGRIDGELWHGSQDNISETRAACRLTCTLTTTGIVSDICAG